MDYFLDPFCNVYIIFSSIFFDSFNLFITLSYSYFNKFSLLPPQSKLKLWLTSDTFTKLVQNLLHKQHKGFSKITYMHKGSLFMVQWQKWNWTAPTTAATIRGSLWIVSIIIMKEITQAKYLFFIKNGMKQKFTFSSRFYPVNLKTQMMTIGIHPMLKK